MVKISLDAVGYAGYFYHGEPVSLEETLTRVAKFGFDAVDIWPHRPTGFPLDISKDRRKALLEQAQTLGLKFAAVGAATNFMRSDHVLVSRQEKEILFLKECCQLARDLDCPIVRIFAGWMGYFMPDGANKGYGNTAMWNARSIEVSKEQDFLTEWDFARAGIKESARIAADSGVTLALQNHPPLTNNTEETIAMVEEIDHPNLKICLDLPLFESQHREFVWETVKKVGKRMIHTHIIGIEFLASVVGRYGFKEVPPFEGPENWIEFFKACRAVGYDGYFAHEQCSPVILKGHKPATVKEFDRRYEQTAEWVRKVFADIDAGLL